MTELYALVVKCYPRQKLFYLLEHTLTSSVLLHRPPSSSKQAHLLLNLECMWTFAYHVKLFSRNILNERVFLFLHNSALVTTTTAFFLLSFKALPCASLLFLQHNLFCNFICLSLSQRNINTVFYFLNSSISFCKKLVCLLFLSHVHYMTNP